MTASIPVLLDALVIVALFDHLRDYLDTWSCESCAWCTGSVCVCVCVHSVHQPPVHEQSLLAQRPPGKVNGRSLRASRNGDKVRACGNTHRISAPFSKQNCFNVTPETQSVVVFVGWGGGGKKLRGLARFLCKMLLKMLRRHQQMSHCTGVRKQEQAISICVIRARDVPYWVGWVNRGRYELTQALQRGARHSSSHVPRRM